MIDEDYQYTPLDRRLLFLSPAARQAVAEYNNDLDEAAFVASIVVHRYARPPQWAVELHGAQRTGWKDFNKSRIR